jgi:hypothetical protein
LSPEPTSADEPIARNGRTDYPTAKRARKELPDGAEAKLNYQARVQNNPEVFVVRE